MIVCLAAIWAMAWLFIPKRWSFKMGLIVRPWRVFMWFWALVGIVGAVLLWYLPESPRWILSTKGVPPTVPILARMFSMNNKKPTSDFPVATVKNEHTLHDTQGHWKLILLDLKQLLKPPMRRCLWVCSFGMAIVFLLERGFYLWIPAFLNEALHNTKATTNICKIIDKLLSSSDDGDGDEIHDCSVVPVEEYLYFVAMIVESLLVVPFLIVFFTIHRFIRVKMYSIIMWTCAAGQILSFIPQAMVSVIFIIIGMCSGSCCCILQIMASDAFPTNLRGMAVSTLYMGGKLGAAVGVSVLEIMAGAGCYVVIILMALLTAGSSLILLKFWPRPIINVRDQMEDRNYIY